MFITKISIALTLILFFFCSNPVVSKPKKKSAYREAITQGSLRKAILKSLSDGDKKSFLYYSFSKKSDFSELAKALKTKSGYKKEKIKALNKTYNELMKQDIDWKNIKVTGASVAGTDSAYSKKGIIKHDYLKITFTSKGKTYKLMLKDIMKISRGWLVGSGVVLELEEKK